MKEFENISSVMLKDHLRLLSLLHNLEKYTDEDFGKKLDLFNRFKWNLEKHIFLEEKTIFTSLKVKGDKGEGSNLFLEISKQHSGILDQLKTIYNNLIKHLDVEVFPLREQMINHQKFEEKVVYPRLDEELEDTEKELIVERIIEII